MPPSGTAVDWAPAYELLISFGCFVDRRLHPILELGRSWVHDVRQQLPPDYAARLAHRGFAAGLKDQDSDLLMLLVRASPGEQPDAQTFLA